jgi:group I intron endonuclease
MKNVIYKIRNVVNNKFYVGSTVDARVRFQAHKRNLKNNKHQSPHMQAAWNKYGEDCFKFEVVEKVDCSENLLIAEQVWLDEHAGKSYCYNWAIDARAPMRGRKHTPEVALKCREAGKKVPSGETSVLYGVPRSDETKKKIGDAQRGVKKAPRVYTEEGLKKAQENMKRNAAVQEIKDIEYILNTFPQEVLYKYDFTNAIYTGSAHRMTGCICPKHGEFTQYSGYFRKGRGCPSCGAEERSVSKSIQMKEYWNTPEGRDTILKSRDKKETDPTKMSEKDQVEFYKTARKNLINDMETLIKPFGWKMEGVSVRTPQYIDSGIECFLKPIKKNKPIDCYDLAKNIELLIRQPNFPFPWIDGDSPDNRGFWIQISTTD